MPILKKKEQINTINIPNAIGPTNKQINVSGFIISPIHKYTHHTPLLHINTENL